MIKQQAANQHRKKGLSRIYIALFWAHKCPTGCEEMRRTTTFHLAKILHIYFSLVSWQFYMFYRCLNIYRLEKCEKLRQITNCNIWEDLRSLKTVSSTNISMGHCNHSLSLDATIMVSKHCPTIGEYVVVLSIT